MISGLVLTVTRSKAVAVTLSILAIQIPKPPLSFWLETQNHVLNALFLSTRLRDVTRCGVQNAILPLVGE